MLIDILAVMDRDAKVAMISRRIGGYDDKQNRKFEASSQAAREQVAALIAERDRLRVLLFDFENFIRAIGLEGRSAIGLASEIRAALATKESQ